MIRLGEYNLLSIARKTDFGLFLTDNEGHEVLLPNKLMPESYEIGEKIKVFVYLDHDERDTATTQTPHITLGKFAFLQVSAVTSIGAFMDWGLQKQLLVPFREQRQKMEEGKSYIVYLDLDEETDRLFASSRLDRYLSNKEIDLIEGDSVEILVSHPTDLGWVVIVNHAHRGLLYKNEVFEPIQVGDTRRAYVKKIREENKLDIGLRALNQKETANQDADLLFEKLREGETQLSDKSSPELIYNTLGISKKAFKKAAGALYKEGKIQQNKAGNWELKS